MSESANDAEEVRVPVGQHWVKWFDGRPLFWIVLIVAMVIFLQAQFWKQASSGDYANWDYMAQVIARGGMPYRDAVNIKSPLSAYIGAAAVVATRPFGLRDIFAIRIVFIVLSALTVAFTFLVTRDYFSDVRTALLAATIILTIEPFVGMNIRGIQPKTTMVLCGLVTLWAIARGRALTAGFFAMLSALNWQPGLLFLGVVVLGFSRYLSRWRDIRVVKSLLGALIPLAVVLAYFWIAGALTDFYRWNIHYNATVYAPHETRSLSNFVSHFSDLLNVFRSSRVYFYIAAIGLLIVMVREVRRGIQQGAAYFLDSCRTHSVMIAPVVYFSFCVIDIQGRADVIPLLPFVAMFAALALGFMVTREAELIARVWSQANVTMIRNVAFVVLFGLVIIIGRSGLSGHRLVFPTLEDQDKAVAEIVSHLQAEDRIFTHGSTEILVLSGLSNASKYFFLDRGKDQYLDLIEPGGFEGWLERLKASRPKVVALGRVADSDRILEMQGWLASDYDIRRNSVFTYYLRRDKDGLETPSERANE